jgi:phage-related protein
MEIKDIPAQTEVYVDSAVGTITDNTSTSLYPHLVGQKFLRLVNGDNVLQISGISELTIRYQNVRYIL